MMRDRPRLPKPSKLLSPTLLIATLSPLLCVVLPSSAHAATPLHPQQPLAQIPAPTVVTSGFNQPRQLLALSSGWLIREASGALWQVNPSGQRSSYGAALPKGGQLLSAELAWTAKSLLQRVGGQWKIIVSAPVGIAAALVHEGALWWIDAEKGGSLRRRALGTQTSAVLATQTGTILGLFPAPGGVDAAVGGDEPRGIKRYQSTTGLKWLAKSRFYTRSLSYNAEGTWALNTTSGGWLERLNGGEFVRLAFAPSGSSHLLRVGGVLYWRSPGAIFRYDVKTGRPEAIAMGTAPVGLVADDSGALLWLDSARGQLLRLAKPKNIVFP